MIRCIIQDDTILAALDTNSIPYERIAHGNYHVTLDIDKRYALPDGRVLLLTEETWLYWYENSVRTVVIHDRALVESIQEAGYLCEHMWQEWYDTDVFWRGEKAILSHGKTIRCEGTRVLME